LNDTQQCWTEEEISEYRKQVEHDELKYQAEVEEQNKTEALEYGSKI